MKRNNISSIKLNYIYNAIYQIFATIIILITTPYVSRVLGSESLGIYGYTYSIITYFILIGSLGIATYGQREIAYVKDDREKRSKIFFELFYIKAIALILMSVIFFAIFCTNGEYKIYYTILDIELLGNIFDIMWLYQGLEDFKKVVIRNMLVRAISTIAIFIFVKSSQYLWIYFVVLSGSSILANLSFIINLKNSIDLSYWNKINLKEAIKKHIKPVLVLFIPQVSMQVYTALDKTMLGLLTNDMNSVGYYEQSQKIVKLAMAIVIAFGTIIYSRMSVNFAKDDKKKINECVDLAFDFVWMVGIPVMFGIMAITNNLVPWYFGNGFEPVKILMVALSPIILIVGISNVVYTQYMISTKHQNEFTVAIIIGAVINTIGNYFLIKICGALGAIISSVIAEFVILLVEVYFCRNSIKIKDNLIDSIKYFIAGIIMYILTYNLGVHLNPTPVSTCIQIITGICVYFLILLVFKEKYSIYYLEKMRKLWKK